MFERLAVCGFRIYGLARPQCKFYADLPYAEIKEIAEGRTGQRSAVVSYLHQVGLHGFNKRQVLESNVRDGLPDELVKEFC